MPQKISQKAKELLTKKHTLESKIKQYDKLLADTYSLYNYHKALLEQVQQELATLQKNTPKDFCN